MAISTSKPLPLTGIPARKLCTVCKTPSYSVSGVHPQCAANHANAVQRAAEKAKAGDAPSPVVSATGNRKWAR